MVKLQEQGMCGLASCCVEQDKYGDFTKRGIKLRDP